ncbi:MAG: fimbrillin family protein [Bacteroidales bacterium]|nr:fimbrillin family protein [Candidatus Cacconaster merdequi]
MNRSNRIISIFTAALLLAGCVTDIAVESDSLAVLRIKSVAMSDINSKAVIEGPLFPAADAEKGIGLFLLAEDGSDYDGVAADNRNVLYKDSGKGWESDKPLELSCSKAVLYGYFPYSQGTAAIDRIPVSSSLNGTDYLYAAPVTGLSNSSPVANIEMKHALAMISVRFVKDGSYPGKGLIKSVGLSGDAIASEGLLDIRDGSISSSADPIDFAVPDAAVTESGWVSDFLVVPVEGADEGSDIQLKCNIDGIDFSQTISGLDVVSGMKSEVVVCVKNIGLLVARASDGGAMNDITVTLADGKKVNLILSNELYDRDLIISARANGSSAVFDAVSKSGLPLLCEIEDGKGYCNCINDPLSRYVSFEISNFVDDVTDVTLGYDVLKMVRTDVPEKSFYKDVFIDATMYLDNMRTELGSNTITGGQIPLIPQAYYDLYGKDTWSDNVEYAWAFNNGASDSLLMRSIICGNESDLNGALLYPDGEPRFKMMFSYGGKASNHGRAVGEDGRNNVSTFYANGGCYVGSCAGAYLSVPIWNNSPAEYSYGLMDGGVARFSGMYISNEPYYNTLTVTGGTRFSELCGFGAGDVAVDSVQHNGGCYLDEKQLPPRGEILALFSSTAYPEENLQIDVTHSNPKTCLNHPCIWAYKRNDISGRLVSCGSHPERCNTEKVNSLYKAEVLYAMEGFGNASAKAVLKNGETRLMNLHKGDPAHCGIGDKQYHHFVIFLAKDVKELTVILDWDSKARLDLGLRHESFAFLDEIEQPFSRISPYENAFVESPLSITLKDVPAGMWFVSVHCQECPGTVIQTWANLSPRRIGGYFEYKGTDEQMAALNGIPYRITAQWKY